MTEWTDYDYTARGPLESKQKKLGVQEAGADSRRLDCCTRIINKRSLSVWRVYSVQHRRLSEERDFETER